MPNGLKPSQGTPRNATTLQPADSLLSGLSELAHDRAMSVGKLGSRRDTCISLSGLGLFVFVCSRQLILIELTGTMTSSIKKTYCRVCEASCGLAVEVEEDGQGNETIRRIRPDDEHPISKGYACIKGTTLGGIHHDPDRVNYPMKRIDGVFQKITWEQAIQEIAERASAIKIRHGANALGQYSGNPSHANYKNILCTSDFIKILGSRNSYASHSIDLNNKFQVASDMYGVDIVHPIPDFEHTQFFMCIGANPVVSQMSVISVINPLEKMRSIEARGGKVIIVDPRRSETASKVGEHLFIQPGTDAFLLLAMLAVLHFELDFSTSERDEFADGARELLAAAKQWTPERVAPITGIAPENIRRIADEYHKADGAALYMSTGVNMGPFGSIAYWVLQGINYLSGNLDKRGGLLIPEGVLDWLGLAQQIIVNDPDIVTAEHGWQQVAGCFPITALPDEILSAQPDHIRALFISAGNPIHSTPHSDWPEAMERLELCVSVDIYINETAERYADYVLPATDMLERSDFPLSHLPLQSEPYAQYSAAVLRPKFERREEWQIFGDLLLAIGAPFVSAKPLLVLSRVNTLLKRLPGNSLLTPDHLLKLLLALGGKASLNQLRATPEGIKLPPHKPGSFLKKRLKRRINLAPSRVLNDLPRLTAYAETLEHGRSVKSDSSLVLIGRRSRKSHNSWMHNNDEIKQPDSNYVYIHPDDAATRQLSEGDRAKISNGDNFIVLPVSITTDLMQGVIAASHGWGHQDSKNRNSSKLSGENVNKVIPGGSAHMEPVSGQAIMLAHPVEVVKLVDSIASS